MRSAGLMRRASPPAIGIRYKAPERDAPPSPGSAPAGAGDALSRFDRNASHCPSGENDGEYSSLSGVNVIWREAPPAAGVTQISV